METPEYFHGGCGRGGNPQFALEKPGKAGDHFIVEDLLDFDNEEDGFSGGGDEGGFEVAAVNSTEESTLTAVDSSSNSSLSVCYPHFPGNLGCRSLADAGLSDDLCLPYEELADLEWLSNFVEESFSTEDLQKLDLISGGVKSSSSDTRSEISAVQGRSAALFRPETAVPGKARSKRSRPAPCSWSSRLIVFSPTTTSSAESELIFPTANSNSSSISNPPPVRKTPKPVKKKESPDGPAPPAASDGRKCLHCATEKTPQWRTGPMGPKTLCNACGVRYKSGRLVQEYRPAASPTFVLSKHSNSHRKVLELRRQKEVQQHSSGQFLHPGAVYEAAATGGEVGEDFSFHHRVGPDFRQLI